MHTIHTDARHAIHEANIRATETSITQVVAYLKGKGWTHYNPVTESVPGSDPEFLCLGLGRIPLPISEHAFDVWWSAVRGARAEL